MVQPILSIIFAIAALVGIIIYLVYQHEKKRIQALEDVAMRNGFSFNQKMDQDIILGDFKIFNKGSSKKSSNLMKGTKSGIKWTIFEYRFTTGGGKNSNTEKQTVAIAKLKNTQLPNFFLGRKNIFHKIGSKFGYKYIDFDQHPVFSNNYLLRGEDEQAIRKVFNSNILIYLEEKLTKATIEAEGSKLIYYIPRKIIKPDQFLTFLDDAEKRVRMFYSGKE
ncbi:MAG: hypothetical protein U9R34_05360 [Nanoarchaeota archaeon]|nr:hypothetical protein [Nanoarchaeota archaeon]